MHIAINAWFWEQLFTGSGQYVRCLVGALRKIAPAIKITLVAPHESLSQVPAGVDVLAIPASMGDVGKVRFEQISFPNAVKKLGAHVAHVPYWGAPLSSPAPLIVTVHDVIPLSMPVYQGGLKARLYFSLVTATAQGAGHIITDSDFSKQEILRHIKIPADKVTAIPLATEEHFHPRLGRENDEAIRRKYNLPEEGYALYMGGFDIRKNVLALIAAYSYVGPSLGDQYPLIITGKAPEAWGTPRFPDVPAAISARPELAQWIRLIGPVDEADKVSVYRMARVFAFPSIYEGFGLGPLEAMATGTPVVAANASCVPELVGDAAYLVPSEDIRAMAGALIAVMIQDDLHASLSNSGLARASQYSWERTARETLAIYERMPHNKAKA
jgi:glycosyltransferase involved in cell wall biosynthesis